MIFRFVIISDEVEDFRRDIRIDASATFERFHDLILESVGYTKGELTRFFVTDKSWRPKEEILLVDMGMGRSEKEYYLMSQTHLDDLLEEEGDRLLFNFDMLGDRYFFIELREVVLGENLKKAEVIRSRGEAPKQLSDVEELLTAEVTKAPIEAKATVGKMEEEDVADFDNDSFDLEDIDVEGFEMSQEDPLEV